MNRRLTYLVLLWITAAAVIWAQAADPIDRRVAEVRQKLGDSYRVARDEQRKVVIVSDLPESAVNGQLARLGQYEDALHATFFDHLPDYWIMVVIPSNV